MGHFFDTDKTNPLGYCRLGLRRRLNERLSQEETPREVILYFEIRPRYTLHKELIILLTSMLTFTFMEKNFLNFYLPRLHPRGLREDCWCPACLDTLLLIKKCLK